MELLTLEKQRARIDNITYAEKNVKKYLRRIRSHNYIPGHANYNMGGYPAKISFRPTEYDYNQLKDLAEKGCGLIQIHEEWNDAIRYHGADKYSCPDKEGLKEFIKLAHSFGIKVLPYISSGFFDLRDPDFKESFCRGDYRLCNTFWQYRMCDHGSAEWVEYLLRHVAKILDEYEFDGLYNDIGFDGDAIHREKYNTIDLTNQEYDPYLEDVLVRLYSFTKERNGICKIHQNRNSVPKAHDKIYDYLWVGEAVATTEDLLKTTVFDPYVLVAPDFQYLDTQNSDKLFAQALPFMQFIFRYDGRPLNGYDIISQPGIEYIRRPETKEGRRKDIYTRLGEHFKNFPDGPYCYSEWSSIPDDPGFRDRWAEYLALYKPMVKENSLCYIDIKESTLTTENVPADVHMSLFINDEKYICISNIGEKAETVVFTEEWIDRRTNKPVRELTIQPDTLYFLQAK